MKDWKKPSERKCFTNLNASLHSKDVEEPIKQNYKQRRLVDRRDLKKMKEVRQCQTLVGADPKVHTAAAGVDQKVATVVVREDLIVITAIEKKTELIGKYFIATSLVSVANESRKLTLREKRWRPTKFTPQMKNQVKI